MNWQTIEKEFYRAVEDSLLGVAENLEQERREIQQEIEGIGEVKDNLYGFTHQVQVKKRRFEKISALLNSIHTYSLNSTLRLKRELHEEGLPAIAVLPEKIAMQLMSNLYIFRTISESGFIRTRSLPETAMEVVPRVMIFLGFFLVSFLSFSFFDAAPLAGAIFSFIISLSIFSAPVFEKHGKKFRDEKFILHDGSFTFTIFQWSVGLFLLFIVLDHPEFLPFSPLLLISFSIRARLTKKNLLKMGYFLFKHLLGKKYYLPNKTDIEGGSGSVKVKFNVPVSTDFFRILAKIRDLGLQPVIAADKRSFSLDDRLLFNELIKRAAAEEEENIKKWKKRDPIIMTIHEINGERFVAVHAQEGDFISEKKAIKMVKKFAVTFNFN